MRAVSHDQANKLAAIGISTAAQLLKAGATPEGRRDLVERTGIDKDHILSFVNYSDLCRIKGISVKYANLLEAAGVDTVKELGKRNATNLHNTLVATNAEHGLVKQLPSAGKVESWVSQAKGMERGVHY
ncbi:MAG: DUF4332 domain-containing protein [Anaerolineales bacterium]|nr:DUF4332 domain-containing protein [Anaerolineales bacterium]MCB9128488.1 DUF4332 domain-containing protein [Ardenticatenales bacterium]MCB9172672.1 DUF4332 domain-containing protein [Ardenticatenales bacterium]